MANLTATAQFSRKAFVVIMIVLGISLAGFLAYTFSASLRDSLFPPPVVAIAAFGKLPPVSFIEGITPPRDVNYTIETISGNLPSLPSIVEVFGIEKSLPSFGDLDQAKRLAQTAGFSDQPVGTYGSKATFVNANAGTTLTIDTTTKNFNVTSDYLNNQKVLSGHPKTEDEAILAAKKYINSFGLVEQDFPAANTTTFNLKVDGNRLSDVPSITASNLIQVNFGRADVNKVPVVYPNFKNPNLWVLVSVNGVAAAKDSLQNIQKHKFSTYPLKGVQKAFEDLKAGKGFYNKALTGSDFPIRSVYLAYLETGVSQTYLEPVYVFKSDEDLFAGVNAIDDSWIVTSQTPNTTNSSKF